MSQSNIEFQNDSDNKLQKKVNSNHMNSIQQTPSSQPFLDDSILFNPDPFSQYTPISEIRQDENNFSKLLESNNPSLNNTRQHQERQNQRRVQPFDSLNQSQASSQQAIDSLEQNINHMSIYCNQTLKNFGYSQLGSLINPRQEDVMQTLNSIYELLQQRQRDLDFRSSIVEKSAKLEQNYKISQEKNEKYQTEIARMKKQIGSLENQITMVEDKSKKEIQRLINERDEFQKNLQKAQQKSNQMQNEIRKKESETNRVKEQMKKLTSDKFEKNNIYRNSVDLISQYSNNHYNGSSNSQASQKPWKNNGSEEFVDCVNQHTLTVNNKLLSENQSFRNTLIQLNNELNAFIKQSKEEYIRKKIKEEGGKDENLKEYYQQKLPDIDLIYFKDDCLNLPYERVGAIVVDIFRENFKVVKLFLASISSLLYSHNYYNELGKELEKIKDNLLKIRSTVDVTKILFTDRSISLPSYTTDGFESAAITSNQSNDAKKLQFEISDFKQGNNQNDNQQSLPSQSPQNTRSQSTNKSTSKGSYTLISNNNNNQSNSNTPSLSKPQSTTRNTSQNRVQGQILQSNNLDKSKLALNKQNSFNNKNLNNNNGLNLIKKDQQKPQKEINQDNGEEKLLNSSKIEQMIKEKLDARLKAPLLPTQGGDINNSNNPKISNSSNININSNFLNKNTNLKDNLLSDRSHLNELEAYLQSYQNENFNMNYDLDKANSNNNDLSLSFVSRVSFRDVPFGGADFDEKMIEGLGITPRDTIKGNVDPKQMHLDMKRWQNILSASNSEASLFNSQNEPNTQSNEQKIQVLLKNINPPGQQQSSQYLQTLNGVDLNNKLTIKK